MTQTATTNLELIQPSANYKALTDEQFMLLKEDDNLIEEMRLLMVVKLL